MKQLVLFDEISKAAVYGVGSYIREIIESLHERYRIVVVIYYSKEKEFTVKEKKSHIELHIPPHQLQYTEGKTDQRYYINSVFLIRNYLRQDEDVIFHFNYFRYESVVDLLREHFPFCKMVFTIHYFYWCFLIDGNTDYFKEIITKPEGDLNVFIEKEVSDIYQKEKAFLEKMDHVFCLAEYARNLLLTEYRIPNFKISLLYNGLKDDGVIFSLEKKEKEKRNLRLPPDSKIILFVGRLDKTKGLDYLISAFKQLCKKRDDCFLIIAGDGEYNVFLNECEECRLNIVFTGRLSTDRVYRYYRIADVGVMLSKHEQCSYVAIEMMMHGLPVIASDSTGLDEMITDGINGYKIRSNYEKETASFDTDTCCDLLLRALSEKSDNLRLNSRARYEQRYRLEQMKKGLLTIYDAI